MADKHRKPNKIAYKNKRVAIRNISLFLLLAAASYFFLNSNVFNVSEIKIEGNETLHPQEIVGLSEIKEGANIFKTNLGEANNQLNLHPLISDVEIRRSFPDSIIISISERSPAAVITYKESFIKICENGYYLEHTDRLKGLEVPIITGLDIEDNISPGQRLQNKKIDSILKILESVESDQKETIAEIDIGDVSHINIFTVNNTRVILGDTEQIDEKLLLAFEILSQADREEMIEYVDVRFPESPVIK